MQKDFRGEIMDKCNSIEVSNISKKFNIKSTTFYGGVTKTGTKQVLSNISFSIKKGEVVGIIGRNGSGKSTLLKILAKIIKEDEGVININGSLSSILELGMGFDPESSGRDNVFIKCGLYGMSKLEIENCIDDILLFSEIGEQADYPLRTYSSGMISKLAFSILLYLKSDILIIDEALSVGDAGFNAKCKLAFNSMKKNGQSVILASHNISTLESMCDRIIWIDEGIVREYGDPVTVCYHYQSDSVDSIDTIKKLADMGDVSSINRVAVMYRDGINVLADLEKAETLFQKAANMGSVDAQINLAECYLKKGDKKNAEQWYNKAALSGNTSAIISLMQINSNESDTTEFEKTLRILSEEGNLRATRLLADLLYKGGILIKNEAEAIDLYKKCEFMNNQVQLIIGIAYKDGIGVQKDMDLSIQWLTKASDHGNIKAKVELANIYRKGIGVSRNMEQAIYWYESAAHCGDPNSMLQLGLIYRDGIGVEKSSALSNKWLDLFSKQQLMNSEFTLAEIIKQSFSGNNQKCFEWYKKAADLGHVRSINIVANHYKEGDLVLPNLSERTKYYRSAYKKQDPSATYELAMMYYKGDGVEQNYEIAYNLMKSATKFGNMKAAYQMAIMCYKGIGTEKDEILSKKILNRLIEHDHNGAKDMVAHM